MIDEYEQFKDFRFFLKQNGQKEWDYSHSIEETLDENLDKSNPLPTLGLYVGKGNGGHGPTHQEVTEINGMIIGAKKLGYDGVFKWSGLNNFFEDVEKYRDQLATWKDELYLEDHRGTFTTHPEIKHHNRRLENLILTSERFVTYHSLINPNYQYPYKILERLWKTLNLLQFHDVLPGSCIPEAFDDLPRIWAEIDLIIKGLFDESFYLRGKTEENRISIINPLDWERRDRLFIPYNVFEPLLPLDSEGKPPYITLEIEDEKLVCQPVAAEQQDILKNNPAGWWTIVNMPANGVLVGSLKIQSEDDIPQKESFLIHNSEKKYSNGLCSIELNSSNGAIKEIIVEGINKNKSLVKGEDNFLVKAYEEPGHDERYPAWNLKEEYWKYPIKYNYAENLSIRILDDGPIFFTIEIKRTLEEGMNKIIQEIRLFKKDPVIYCSWIADWKQADVMLKIGIDTTTNAKECISEQMFCDLKRSTEPHTLRDKARYEKIMHSYVDLSTPDNSWGIALLNEGKYAFDCRKSTNIDLTLHKTAIYPQPNAESWANIEREFRKKMDGEQVPKNVGLRLLSCRFAYYPHSNGMYIKNESGYKSLVRQKAKEFNNPLFVWKNTQSPKAIKKDSLLLEISSSVFWRLPSNIEVVSIKRSEWDPKNSIIIRLYENCGQSLLKENGEVHLPDIFKGKIKNLIAVDLLEREIKHEFEWLKNSNIIKVSFRPFETCSFELMFS